MKAMVWLSGLYRCRRSAVRLTAPGEGRGQSLSSLWTVTLSSMVAVVIGLSGIALGATLYQRAAFDDVTTQLETELDATASLVRELRSVDIPMSSILYEIGAPRDLQAQVRLFNQRRRAIAAAFDRAEIVLPVRDVKNPLAQARAAWEKTAEAVLAARKLWGTDVVKDAVGSGHDPFADEWTRLGKAQGVVTELTAHSLTDLRRRTTSVDRVQRLIPYVVLGALGTSLLLGAWSARRLSRRVVAPVLELRNAANRMRDGDLRTTIELGTAVGRELRDLAQAMNELAISLHASHTLLRDQACTDALTGLPNRKALTEHLASRRERHPAQGTALLFVDLDDFKLVNDSLGHDAGDQLLTIVAARVSSSTRDTDLVARLGGDEFAVALNDGWDPAAARAAGRRILAALSEPVSIQDTTLTVGCSIGIALTGDSAVTVEELLRQADTAMYAAKNAGKHRLAMYAETMHTGLADQMQLTTELGNAVSRDQVVLPISQSSI